MVGGEPSSCFGKGSWQTHPGPEPDFNDFLCCESPSEMDTWPMDANAHSAQYQSLLPESVLVHFRCCAESQPCDISAWWRPWGPLSSPSMKWGFSEHFSGQLPRLPGPIETPFSSTGWEELEQQELYNGPPSGYKPCHRVHWPRRQSRLLLCEPSIGERTNE